MNKKVRTRFAPSPTGRMHVGNLRTALYAYLIAKHEGGDFVLRIEDTDQERYVEEALDIIYRTMEKTGLIHDEGPDKDGGYGPYVQSERQAQGIYLKDVYKRQDETLLKPYLYASYKYLSLEEYHILITKHEDYMRINAEMRREIDDVKNGLQVEPDEELLEKWKRQHRRSHS